MSLLPMLRVQGIMIENLLSGCKVASTARLESDSGECRSMLSSRLDKPPQIHRGLGPWSCQPQTDNSPLHLSMFLVHNAPHDTTTRGRPLQLQDPERRQPPPTLEGSVRPCSAAATARQYESLDAQPPRDEMMYISMKCIMHSPCGGIASAQLCQEAERCSCIWLSP